MAEMRLPGAMALIPRSRHSLVTLSRRAASSLISPTGMVSALSACQPSLISPMSIPTMSPSTRARPVLLTCSDRGTC